MSSKKNASRPLPGEKLRQNRACFTLWGAEQLWPGPRSFWKAHEPAGFLNLGAPRDLIVQDWAQEPLICVREKEIPKLSSYNAVIRGNILEKLTISTCLGVLIQVFIKPLNKVQLI